MRFSTVLGLLVVGCSVVMTAGQSAAPIDTAKIGPQVGTTVPPFEGVDQFGRKQTLTSIAKARGTMLVFFRSADW